MDWRDWFILAAFAPVWLWGGYVIVRVLLAALAGILAPLLPRR